MASGITVLLASIGVAVVAGAESGTNWCDSSRTAATSTTGSVAATAKRGVGTWYFDGVNQTLEESTGLSWYYTWNVDQQGVQAPPATSFVPMIWGAAKATAADLAAAQQAGDTLLGFNEPDRSDQSNMTVDQAIQLWPSLQATGMRLGSPAVSANAAKKGSWLDRFMKGAQTNGLSVDFIALHWYGSDFSAPAQAAHSLCTYLADTYERYKKPLWLTEFALADFTLGTDRAKYPTEQQQEQFAVAAERMLDSLPFVERYAWFALSDTGSDFQTGLYSAAQTLTPAGAAYLGMDR